MSNYEEKVDQILDELGEAYHNDYPNQKAHKKAKQALIELVAKNFVSVEQHERELEAVILESIELLETLTPARPEDLTQSQWYGLVDGITAATVELKNGVAELSSNKQGGK